MRGPIIVITFTCAILVIVGIGLLFDPCDGCKPKKIFGRMYIAVPPGDVVKEVKKESSYPAAGIYAWYFDGKKSLTGENPDGVLSLIQDYCKEGHGTTTVVDAKIGVNMFTECQE